MTHNIANDGLMTVLSTAKSQYSFKWLPQLGKSRPTGLLQWRPVIDTSTGAVRHSHHVPMALISRRIQSTFTDRAGLASHPLICASQRQWVIRACPIIQYLLEVIADWLDYHCGCCTILLAPHNYDEVIIPGKREGMKLCYTVHMICVNTIRNTSTSTRRYRYCGDCQGGI